MESSDELVADPDAKGFLDLTNRAWVKLDSAVWGLYVRIINNLVVILCSHVHL